ncbi:MAG: hypothetical protein P1V20_15340 [Verrucomicrobiales bacterium]|nr:hypothetical protein [Verrucomicrobiales bacterium]
MSLHANLPTHFEGTTQQEGSEEHAFLSMRVDRVWKNRDKNNLRTIRGIFKHLGPPIFGRGFMMAETDFVGSWDQESGDFSFTEAIPFLSGKTKEKTFRGKLSSDGSQLIAERSDGAEHIHLFARSS